jgi:hypothetical protein
MVLLLSFPGAARSVFLRLVYRHRIGVVNNVSRDFSGQPDFDLTQDPAHHRDRYGIAELPVAHGILEL